MAKAKTYKGKSLKLGGGGQFQRMVDAIMRGNPNMSEQEAKAIAAKQGMAKYGKGKMMSMAAKGKKRAARKGK
jgi:hypothetical protein